MANDAREVLDACGGTGATVLGTSMGGLIAQELAIRHPEYVDRLLLVSARPPTPSHVAPGYSPMLSILGRPAQGQSLDAFFGEMWGGFAAEGFSEAHTDVITEMVGQMLTRVTPRSMVLRQARAISAWHGARRLARIKAPTTVVHGQQDPLVPTANGKLLADLIPGADFVELPLVGHLVPQEAGHALIKLLDV
jgi:pimeloyl-ACP methyl ester carboxylesterase